MTAETVAEDASSFDKYDDRGTFLTHLVVTTGGAPIDEKRLSERGAHVRVDDDGTWWADLYLLPAGKSLDENTLYVSAEIHSHGPEHDETHWELNFLRAPGGEVPDLINERRFAGEFPENFTELLNLGTFQGSTEIHARAHYLIRQVQFKHALDDLGFGRVRRSQDVEMSLSSCVWDVVGSRPLERLTLQAAPYEGAAWLSARGELDVKLSATLCDDVDRILWGEVERCLIGVQSIAAK